MSSSQNTSQAKRTTSGGFTSSQKGPPPLSAAAKRAAHSDDRPVPDKPRKQARRSSTDEEEEIDTARPDQAVTGTRRLHTGLSMVLEEPQNAEDDGDEPRSDENKQDTDDSDSDSSERDKLTPETVRLRKDAQSLIDSEETVWRTYSKEIQTRIKVVLGPRSKGKPSMERLDRERVLLGELAETGVSEELSEEVPAKKPKPVAKTVARPPVQEEDENDKEIYDQIDSYRVLAGATDVGMSLDTASTVLQATEACTTLRATCQQAIQTELDAIKMKVQLAQDPDQSDEARQLRASLAADIDKARESLQRISAPAMKLLSYIDKLGNDLLSKAMANERIES